MKAQYRKAFNALKQLGCPVFERADHPTRFLISAEDPNSYDWAEYDGRADWEHDNISPVLRSTLSKFDLYAEWESPGCLVVYTI